MRWLIVLALVVISHGALTGLTNYYTSNFGGGYVPFTALLNGAQVVPALNNSYGGAAACLLNINSNPLLLSCQIVHNVPVQTVTSITINLAGAGSNGALAFSFSGASQSSVTNDFPLSNNINSKQIVNSLLNNQASISVNTAAYPQGIIRGQLTASASYFSALSGDQVLDDDDGHNDDSTSQSLGVGVFSYNYQTSVLNYTIYHDVPNYYRGGIFVGTYGNFDANVATFTSTASPINQATILTEPEAYILPINGLNVNIPSQANPYGDIRGQISGGSYYTYTQVAFLNNATLGTNSLSSGIGLFSYNCNTRVLDYFVVQNVLTVKSIGLYDGSTRIFSFPNPSSPSVGTRILNANSVSDLFNGAFSVRVESSSYPHGEISGSVTNSTYNYGAILNGQQVVPSVTTSNAGAFILEYLGNRVVTYAALINLSNGRDGILSVEFHNSPFGTNNNTVLWSFSNPASSALLTDGLRVLNDDQLNTLFSNNLYVLVKTLRYPTGELRGQVNRLFGSQCSQVPQPADCLITPTPAPLG